MTKLNYYKNMRDHEHEEKVSFEYGLVDYI